MILEFSVGNFLSFKEPAKLSMVAAKAFKEFEDSHALEAEEGLRVLKSAVLYGNNASGKSNLLTAIIFMRSTVLNSFRDSLVNNEMKTIVLEKFHLDRASLAAPAFFEVTFLYQGTKYRYGYEIDYDRIVKEWLFHTTTKEVYLFKRTGQTFEVNKSAFKEGLGLDQYAKENVLFLTLVAQMNGFVSRKVVDWFGQIKTVNGVSDIGHQQITKEKLKSDPNFRKWAAEFLRYLEISAISTEKTDLAEIDERLMREAGKDEEFINLVIGLQNKLKSTPQALETVLVWHRQYEGGVLADTIPFELDQHESAGTKKLIYLLGPWYEALRNGSVLIVDELDARMHCSLTLKLLEFFHKENTTGAQLIFAAHDISILDKDVFRRDQIWFVEKDQFGASTLYSLADFKSAKVRNKTAFAKNYLEGKYGAIPYFELDEKINNLLYGQKA